MTTTRSRQPAANGGAAAGRMTLANVRQGVRPAPDRILMHGVEGVGKSTFAADAPNPIFIAAEDGVRHLDVASFPEPQSYQDVLDAILTLLREEHDYRTLVVDTVDWLEPIIWDFYCKRHGWQNIEDPGYGKGYTIVMEGWRKLLSGLDQLRARKNMEIILLAHTAVSTFQNPAGEDYSRYEPKLQKRATSTLKEWADTVLFANFEEFVKEGKGFNKAKGVSTGRRVIHTHRCAAWDAKERCGLPDELPLSYFDFAEARAAARPADDDDLAREADALLADLALDEATEKQTRAWLEKAKASGAIALAKAVDRLRSKVAEQGGA